MAKRQAQADDPWAGFVDVLSNVVLVVTFIVIILGIAMFAMSTQMAKTLAEQMVQAEADKKAAEAELQQLKEGAPKPGPVPTPIASSPETVGKAESQAAADASKSGAPQDITTAQAAAQMAAAAQDAAKAEKIADAAKADAEKAAKAQAQAAAQAEAAAKQAAAAAAQAMAAARAENLTPEQKATAMTKAAAAMAKAAAAAQAATTAQQAAAATQADAAQQAASAAKQMATAAHEAAAAQQATKQAAENVAERLAHDEKEMGQARNQMAAAAQTNPGSQQAERAARGEQSQADAKQADAASASSSTAAPVDSQRVAKAEQSAEKTSATGATQAGQNANEDMGRDQQNADRAPNVNETGGGDSSKGELATMVDRPLLQPDEIKGDSVLTVRSRFIDNPQEMTVAATEDQGAEAAEGNKVTRANEVVRVKFERRSFRLNPDIAQAVQTVFEKRLDPNKEPVEIVSFATSGIGSITEARRIAYYRAMELRNFVIERGYDSKNVSILVRESSELENENTVRVFVVP